MWDGGDLEEIQKVGPTIHTSEDWKTKLISLGDKAMAEQRTENAIAYYRMSEFFMYDGDPDKKKYYKKARSFSTTIIRNGLRAAEWSGRRCPTKR